MFHSFKQHYDVVVQINTNSFPVILLLISSSVVRVTTDEKSLFTEMFVVVLLNYLIKKSL